MLILKTIFLVPGKGLGRKKIKNKLDARLSGCIEFADVITPPADAFGGIIG